MRSEQVLLCEGDQQRQRRCRVDKIILPDIRFQGLFVSREEQEVIESAYQHAVRVRDLIIARGENSHQERFEIDIPDLWFIATRTDEGGVRVMRAELREEIVTFSMLFQGLVRHFLPRAKSTGYSYDGKTKHGVKYKGIAWVS